MPDCFVVPPRKDQQCEAKTALETSSRLLFLLFNHFSKFGMIHVFALKPGGKIAWFKL
jgi:hypothetical protein